jgi:hypothetical protein
MIGRAAVPFFARWKRSATPQQPQEVKRSDRADHARRAIDRRRSREPTTFQKCLAVHMACAAPNRAAR